MIFENKLLNRKYVLQIIARKLREKRREMCGTRQEKCMKAMIGIAGRAITRSDSVQRRER